MMILIELMVGAITAKGPDEKNNYPPNFFIVTVIHDQSNPINRSLSLLFLSLYNPCILLFFSNAFVQNSGTCFSLRDRGKTEYGWDRKIGSERESKKEGRKS